MSESFNRRFALEQAASMHRERSTADRPQRVVEAAALFLTFLEAAK